MLHTLKQHFGVEFSTKKLMEQPHSPQDHTIETGGTGLGSTGKGSIRQLGSLRVELFLLQTFRNFCSDHYVLTHCFRGATG